MINKTIFALIIATLLLSIIQCKQDHIPNLNSFIGDITSIIIYDFLPDNYSIDDLINIPHTTFSVDLFKNLASQVKYKNSNVIWKGSSIAVVKLKNRPEIYLQLSYYGGFFKIIGEKGFYYFEGETKDRYLNAYNQEILQGILIPKRDAYYNKNELKKP